MSITASNSGSAHHEHSAAAQLSPARTREVRRVDALYSIVRYAQALQCDDVSQPHLFKHSKIVPVPTTTPTPTPAMKDVIALFTDWRFERTTGNWVHSDLLGKVVSYLPEVIRGVHVQTIPLASSRCRGMAVNRTETRMVVSCTVGGGGGDKLHVYALPDGNLLKSVGNGSGARPGQFTHPERVCFGPDDELIVADCGNNRLQLFNSDGEYQRSIPTREPFSVTVSNDATMIAVGSAAQFTKQGSIKLFQYTTGNVLREFGGSHVMGIAFALRFTPDDTHIAVTSSANAASLFAVCDGSYVKSVCRGITAGSYYRDIVFSSDSEEVIVAEYAQNRVFVFRSGGGWYKGCWGEQGLADGQFQAPTALTLVNGRLYVLDGASSRVQVFE